MVHFFKSCFFWAALLACTRFFARQAGAHMKGDADARFVCDCAQGAAGFNLLSAVYLRLPGFTHFFATAGPTTRILEWIKAIYTTFEWEKAGTQQESEIPFL
jgi:hypothetical protein